MSMLEILSSPSFRHLLCTSAEFQLLDFIQQGGSGKVYSGYWNKKRKKVALKFFGYAIQEPNEDDIINEIKILQRLQHINGFVKLEAVFFDSSIGKADHKLHQQSFPCIVMELLEGKELIEVIDQHRQISEHDLATIFLQLITALNSCHEIGFVHRDLKLQNLMFADKDSLTSCKIIDCGMMIQLPPNEKVYTSTKIQGTMGYVAPESLSKKQYSSASDIWQAGICLYSLLSGSYPFNPRYPEHVIERGYVPMNGLGWKNISDNAKNLVDKMLIKNPQDRITISQILQHPWLQINGATSEALGPAYNARLKQLLLRQKLKEFFVDSDLETTITTQRENLLEVAPILRKFSRQRKPKVSIAESPNTRPRRPSLKILPVDGENDQPTISTPTTTTTRSTFSPSRPPLPRPNLISTPSTAPRFPMLSTPTSRFGKSSSSGGSGSGSGSNSYEKMREFNIKLNQLKSVVISWVHKVKSTVQTSLNSSSSSSNNSNYIDNFNSSLNYESFERILLDCGLDEIAKPEVFSIFDIEKTGQIRLRDVLLTLQAFKPLNDVYDEDGRLDSARFYFRLFDIDESGTIDINDLKIVISCLVLNDLPILSSLSAPPSPPTSSNSVNYVPNKSCVNELPDDLTARSVNDLFSLINISSDGRIDFDEFRIFYDAILAYSNTRQTVVSYETEATKKIDQIILEDQFRCFGFDF